jgi:dimethylglycine dehydrogenase
MGYISNKYAQPDTEVHVEILGDLYCAVVQGAPSYDPNGELMRS